MKRHTNTKIKNIGIALTIATVAGGVVTFANPTWAENMTKTAQVDLFFTVEPKLTITISDQSGLSIGNLTPGNTGESNTATVTVNTNDAQGCSIKATIGTGGSSGSAASTDLTSSSGGESKFTQLTESDGDGDGGKSLDQIPDNQWGVAFHAGNGNFDNAKYFGFPGDKGDQGAEGKEILKVTQPTTESNSTVQVKVGAKAGANMQPGTYTNQINFYAVAGN